VLWAFDPVSWCGILQAAVDVFPYYKARLARAQGHGRRDQRMRFESNHALEQQ